ncbi:MAG TPA: hypothetical protein VNZ27_04955 [Rhodanobacter sp.]|nr:hypothetical protein [Rhodanobacter sp.]
MKLNSGHTLERVQAALEGRYDPDQLAPSERKIFDDLLGQVLAVPTTEELAFFAQMREQGGGVGYDELGRLVRGLPNGDSEIIDDADGRTARRG